MIKVLKKNKKKVILHIGMNKAGSTSIQNFFHSNRDLWKENGVLYPTTGINGEAHYALSRALGFYNGNQGGFYNSSEFRSLKKSLEKEIIDSGCHIIVISSEDFVLNGPSKMIKKFFSGWDVKVLVYLRRHDSWWESSYAQAVKMKRMPPWPRGVMGYVNFHKKSSVFHSDYKALVDKWSNIFGTSNILVQPFEREQLSGGLIYNFLSKCGIDNHIIERYHGESNTNMKNVSISRLGINLLDVYQRLDIDESIRERLIEYSLSLSKEDSVFSLIKPEIKRDIIRSNEDAYSYIAIKYLNRANGVLFFSPLPVDEPDWSPSYCDPICASEHLIAALGLSR